MLSSKKELIIPHGSTPNNHKHDQSLLTLLTYSSKKYYYIPKIKKVFGIKVNQNPKLGSLDRPNSYIGRSLPRENAKKHLDGGGQFVDDLTLPRMVHVAFLRSPFAHAEIKSINIEDVEKETEKNFNQLFIN